MDNTMEQETTFNREREEYCAGLEQLAQFLRSHAAAPLPSTDLGKYLWSKVDFANAVRAMGSVQKEYTEYFTKVRKNFGPIIYSVQISRDKVCTRKVIGKKQVPATEGTYYPGTPAHEEDIIEWECESILAPEQETQTEEVKESV